MIDFFSLLYYCCVYDCFDDLLLIHGVGWDIGALVRRRRNHHYCCVSSSSHWGECCCWCLIIASTLLVVAFSIRIAPNLLFLSLLEGCLFILYSLSTAGLLINFGINTSSRRRVPIKSGNRTLQRLLCGCILACSAIFIAHRRSEVGNSDKFRVGG